MSQSRISHTNLINVMQDLGYKGSKEGICAGITYMWLQAYLLGDEDKYIKRLNLICEPDFVTRVKELKLLIEKDEKRTTASKKIVRDQIKEIKQTLLQLEKKIEKEPDKKTNPSLDQKIKLNKELEILNQKESGLSKLTPLEKEMLDVFAFFDSVEVYQQPEFHTELFGQRVNQHSAEASRVAMSKEIDNKDGLTYASWLFLNTDLDTYFNNLRKMFVSINHDKLNKPTIIRLGTEYHSTTIFYSEKTDEWVLFDVNQLPPKKIPHSQIANIVKEATDQYKKIAGFTFNIYCTTDNWPHLLPYLEKNMPEKPDIFVPPDDKSGRTLAHYIAEEGSIVSFRLFNSQIAGNDVKLLNQSDNLGRTPVHCAVLSDNIGALKELTKTKVIDYKIEDKLGKTVLRHAVEKCNLQMIDTLVDHGADFDFVNLSKPSITPMQWIGVLIKLKDLKTLSASTQKAIADTREQILSSFTSYMQKQPIQIQKDSLSNILKQQNAFGMLFNSEKSDQELWNECNDSIQSITYSEAYHGKTMVHGAAELGKKIVLQKLCTAGDLLKTYNGGRAPLVELAANKQLDIITELIALHGESILSSQYMSDVAAWAVSYDDRKFIKLLIDNNFNFEQKASSGQSIAHYAVSFKKDDILKMLSDSKVDLNIKDAEGKTPLFYAFNRDDSVTCGILEKGRANYDFLISLPAKDIVDFLFEKKLNYKLCETLDGKRNEILQATIMRLEEKSKKSLDPKQYMKNELQKIINNDFDMGCYLNRSKRDNQMWLECEKILDSFSPEEFRWGASILTSAKVHDKRLLSIIDNKELNKSHAPQTSPFLAAYCDQVASVKEMLQKDGPVLLKMKDEFGFTLLHSATKGCAEDTMKLLLDCKADVNCRNSFGDTPLHLAAADGDVSLIKQLLDSKADASIRNYTESEPPVVAAEKRNIDALHLFIKNGFKLMTTDLSVVIPYLLAVDSVKQIQCEPPENLLLIKNDYKAITDSFIKYVSDIPNPIEKIAVLNLVVNGKNALGELLNKPTNKVKFAVGSFFGTQQYKGNQVSDSIQKIINSFPECLSESLMVKKNKL